MTSLKRRHIASLQTLKQHDASPIVIQEKDDESVVVVGIEIGGWSIRTNQGSIANEETMTAWTDALEHQSQFRGTTASQQQQQRRLCLPEMVFSQAQVSMERKNKTLLLVLDAYQPLEAWAQAHAQISLCDDDDDKNKEYVDNGVNVLKTCDAELWMSKNASEIVGNRDNVFHYDWTFSTPHACEHTSCRSSSSSSDKQQKPHDIWIPLTESGIDVSKLQDRSVPILFFDSLVLYEDDLHDNGQVSLCVKIRVMPNCIFVLQRLFVRVDGVVIRIRDVRVMVDFLEQGIYRDVLWRECAWQDLQKVGLPNDVRAWRLAEEDPQQASLQRMIEKVTTVMLPATLSCHAVLGKETRIN